MALLKPASAPRVAAFLAAVALAAAALPAPSRAQELTQEEALALAFPGADSIRRRTAYLEDHQLARIAKATGPEAGEPSAVAPHYVAFQDGAPVGAAYFDAHRVRTMDQVLMIVVGRDDRVMRIETIRFREPPEYEAPERWLELFRDRGLGPDLSLKGEIPSITGATLTARAVTRAVRRALALHAEVSPFETGPLKDPEGRYP